MPLTLSRREDEALILETSNGPIAVWIDTIRQDSLKLSIDVPEKVRMLRDELAEEVE